MPISYCNVTLDETMARCLLNGVEIWGTSTAGHIRSLNSTGMSLSTVKCSLLIAVPKVWFNRSQLSKIFLLFWLLLGLVTK